MQFSEFDLDGKVLSAIDKMGFKTATSIQQLSIPEGLMGRDILASAPTGTGKTAAFLIPAIQYLLDFPRRDPGFARVLIMTPTRELAYQVHEQCQLLAANTHLKIGVVTGGINYGSHKEIFEKNNDILIATPGRLIEYLENENYPPLKIKGTGLKSGTVSIDGSISSQFLTAFLMAAPLAEGEITIKIEGELVSKPYIDITLHIMKQFGVDVINNDYQEFVIPTGQQYVAPGDFLVEGDASSASYFLAAAAIKGGEIKVTGIGKNSIQGDIQFADALEKMGAEIEWGDDYVISRVGQLKGIDMDYNHIPDAAMTIATTALFAEGTTAIRNVYNWRVKETDRLAAMATELRKVGAEVEEGEDYIIVQPVSELKHAAIDTYDDHRMAMCFSLVALSDTPVTINDPGCTSKTFPDYFDKLKMLSQ